VIVDAVGEHGLIGLYAHTLGHFRRYSEAELRKKMESVGFQVENILRFNRVSAFPGT
jgi:hypothetical protein